MEVALTLGGSVLSAFLQVVFDRVASREFLNLFRRRKNDHQLLNKLKRILLVIQAVLDDAEWKKTGNLAIWQWLDELHGAVYSADDLLDQINTEALRVNLECEQQIMINQVTTSTTYLSYTDFLKGMMPKIKAIVDALEDMVKQIEILGLKKREVKKHSIRLPSTSLVDESIVYGRDVDKEKIINALLCDVTHENDVVVVPIVGMGGIGKTTVAQLVYSDNRVKASFDVLAWVCVSEEYNAVRITKLLLEETGFLFDSLENFNSLQLKLQQSLTGKKFLFVLDDVWNSCYNDWDILKSPFRNGKQGSKIIVTTRDERVALMMRNGPIHSLDLISDEDCWSLFEKHAFRNGDCFRNQELEVIGKKIVKKCKGLPLAAKVAGGLLRSKGTVKEWNDILNSEEWHLSGGQNCILPALRLSYTHMPSHLKRCFAYCAVFHKDCKFRKEEVILLWIGNDLLKHPGNRRRIEDIGEEYFCELRQRALFLQSGDDYFSMHDLINDLAKSVSGKYCLRLEDHHQQQYSTLNEVRHLSYRSSFWDVFEKFKQLNQAKNLRTFLPVRMDKYIHSLSNKFLHEILPTFRSLKVLSLSGYQIICLPESMKSLKQLRFLDLSLTKINCLPDWICTFYNLQTLLLSDCKNLCELPEDMGKLINLRHLDITGVPLSKLPTQIGDLKCLQVLTAFVSSSNHPGLAMKDLGKLNNLHGKLKVSGLENVIDGIHALQANIKGKQHLEELSLNWNDAVDDSRKAIDVLQNLQPCETIKCLEINGYGGTSFPSWLGDHLFHNIVSLNLSSCANCFYMPPLGQLLSLKFLTISDMGKISTIGMEFYGNVSVFDTFQSLQTLRIEEMPEWKEWYVPGEGVFCSLQELNIINCPKLIGHFSKLLLSLQKLEISGCPELVLLDGRLKNYSSLHSYSLHKLKISNMPDLREFSSELQKLTALEEFEISNCPSLVSIRPRTIQMGCLPATLKILKIFGCPELEFLQQDWVESSILSLDRLKIREACDTLKVLALDSLPKVRDIEIECCRNLEVLSIRQGSENLASLGSLLIWGCENLISFPEGGFPATNLSWIMLYGCKKLKSLPEGMRNLLPSLRFLHLWNCPEIECFPDQGLLLSLETLEIYKCEKLMTKRNEWDLHTLPSLGTLMVGATDEELFGGDWLLPRNLRVLRIFWHYNLEILSYRCLQQLISLETMCIWGCHRLRSLPEEGLPTSLSQLVIHDCPLLKPRLECENGQDWCKVAHISCLMVDGDFVP